MNNNKKSFFSEERHAVIVKEQMDYSQLSDIYPPEKLAELVKERMKEKLEFEAELAKCNVGDDAWEKVEERVAVRKRDRE